MTIFSVENGSRNTTFHNLAAIAKGLDVSLVELLYGDLNNLDGRLYESFAEAAKLDDYKKNMICNIVNQMLQDFEDM